MAIFEITDAAFRPLDGTTFEQERFRERDDLQRLLRDNIAILATDILIIAEEFSRWTEGSRRIDLLGVDREANLVVIELKRTSDGGHMELQALRYAAMVSTLTFDEAVETFKNYLTLREREEEARQTLRDHLGWDGIEDPSFNQHVRIILASMDFDKEITSTVLWLNGAYNLDIRCIRIKPYRLGEHFLVDIQQVIPLPEATEYQVRTQRKAQVERIASTNNRDMTKYDVTINGQTNKQLAKGQALLLIVKYLCSRGVTPEQIAATVAWRIDDMWRWTQGTLNATEFQAKLIEAHGNGGRSYDPRRVFGGEEQLIHSEGKTFAFTTQWTNDKFIPVLNRLCAANIFPGTTISYSKSDQL